MPASADGSHGWLPNPFGAVTLLAGAGLAAAHAGSHAVLHPREAFERSRDVVELLIRAELVAAPASSLNVPIGSTRLFATVNVDFHELQDIRSALGGTVNDVVLCAATGALRALLLERGEQPPPRGLRAMVPVSVRREGDDDELGNHVSSLFVDLPVAESDPLRRYELVSAATKRLKAGGQAHAASALTDLTELAPPVLHAGLARSLFAKRLFNVTITNVPGPPSSLSAFGSELLEILPIVPLAADHALGIAVVSYAGAMTFGLFADRASVPDLDVLGDGIVNALSELEALARAAPVH
jgi:diacylglycerol O-acyltransferase / wax synthase